MRSAIPVVEPAAVAYPTSTRVASSIGRPCRRRTRVDEGPMTPEVGTEVAVRRARADRPGGRDVGPCAPGGSRRLPCGPGPRPGLCSVPPTRGPEPRVARVTRISRPAITVFLLDDHEVVRRGVADVLESDPRITVIGEGKNASEALARVPALKPRRRRSSTCGCPTATA